MFSIPLKPLTLMLGWTLGFVVESVQSAEPAVLSSEEQVALHEMIQDDSFLVRSTLSQEAWMRFENQQDLGALGKLVRIEAVSETPEISTQGRAGEFVHPGVFYSQLENFSQGEIERVVSEWREAQRLKADTLVLDLRTPAESEDPSVLVPLLEPLVPANAVLYRSVRNGQVLEIFSHASSPFWEGQVVVMVDETSSDLARLLASLLQLHLKAWVMGELGVGEVYAFAPLALSETHRALVAEAMLRLDAERAPLAETHHVGLPLRSNAEGKAAWRKDRSRELKSLYLEQAPRRLDEKALLAQEDPEWDFRLARRDRTNSKSLPPDTALIQALDLVLARRFLKPEKLTLPAAPNGGNMFELPQDP